MLSIAKNNAHIYKYSDIRKNMRMIYNKIMQKNFDKKFSSGFIGLLALLIAVAIIAILIVRSDLFSRSPDGKNTIEGGFDAIDAAKNAKYLIEQHSKEAAGQ